MRSTILFFFFLVFCSNGIVAQERTLVPQASFLGDSVKVGEYIGFSLKYTYPREMNLIFPDSTYDFFPFEYVSKTFFPTQADSAHLTDSVVYMLATFELDSALYLSAPVFVLEGSDCVKYFSNIDSVHLIHSLDSLPMEPKTVSNTEYAAVSKDFNYIYFLIGTGVFLLVVVVVAVLYGRRIMNWIKIRRLEKAYRLFSNRYQNLLKLHSGNIDRKVVDEVLKLWKGYMEKTEKRPFTKLTTKEINYLYSEDAELNKSLRELDRVLYGGFVSNEMYALFGNLVDFSKSRLRLQIERIKNG